MGTDVGSSLGSNDEFLVGEAMPPLGWPSNPAIVKTPAQHPHDDHSTFRAPFGRDCGARRRPGPFRGTAMGGAGI